jgi:hypothetical protein
MDNLCSIIKWTVVGKLNIKGKYQRKARPSVSAHMSPRTLSRIFISSSSVMTFFSPEGGLGQTQAWMPTYVSILRIPQMI